MTINIPTSGTETFTWSYGHGRWLDVTVKRRPGMYDCHWQFVHYGDLVTEGREQVPLSYKGNRAAACCVFNRIKSEI